MCPTRRSKRPMLLPRLTATPRPSRQMATTRSDARALLAREAACFFSFPLEALGCMRKVIRRK